MCTLKHYSKRYRFYPPIGPNFLLKRRPPPTYVHHRLAAYLCRSERKLIRLGLFDGWPANKLKPENLSISLFSLEKKSYGYTTKKNIMDDLLQTLPAINCQLFVNEAWGQKNKRKIPSVARPRAKQESYLDKYRFEKVTTQLIIYPSNTTVRPWPAPSTLFNASLDQGLLSELFPPRGGGIPLEFEFFVLPCRHFLPRHRPFANRRCVFKDYFSWHSNLRRCENLFPRLTSAW